VAVTELPRFPLAALPTHLSRARRLERALGCPPLYVKRDDLTGFAVAGNKARKLEFLLADAQARGCDTLVTGGGASSNHVAASAVAARVAGLACHLVLYGAAATALPAGLALAVRSGAAVHYTGSADRASVDPALDELAATLAADGRRPYVVPRGGATPVGSVGYATAVSELVAQLEDLDVRPEVLLVATGSCGTQAGLIVGTLAGGHHWRVVGASVSRPVEECRARTLELGRDCAALLGTPTPGEENVEIRDARGPGFGLPSRAGDEMAELAARCEGLLLDPVYTAKALSELPALVAGGVASPIVWWHTGGLPAALFRAATEAAP
jgi:1-aminocyclopropane-1-carboxylate deaminase/D-cysteine desulfhydrase-like pyridoxal-dependent ACC family enzyme